MRSAARRAAAAKSSACRDRRGAPAARRTRCPGGIDQRPLPLASKAAAASAARTLRAVAGHEKQDARHACRRRRASSGPRGADDGAHGSVAVGSGHALVPLHHQVGHPLGHRYQGAVGPVARATCCTAAPGRRHRQPLQFRAGGIGRAHQHEDPLPPVRHASRKGCHAVAAQVRVDGKRVGLQSRRDPAPAACRLPPPCRGGRRSGGPAQIARA